MDVERRPSPPPLLAYTSSRIEKSSQKQSRQGKFKAKPIYRKVGISETYRSNANQARPRIRKAQGKIEFDESARREYLTGFHKRKQAKIVKGKEKAKEREREEKKLLRQETREARKKQAAENVEAEKKAYGNLSDAESEDRDQPSSAPQEASAFESEQHHTTIIVSEFDPNAPEAETTVPAKRPKMIREALPPSSRRMTKKLKNSLPGAKEISRLLDSSDEEVEIVQERDYPADSAAFTAHTIERKTGAPVTKPKKATFHYESKLDRAKARAEARENKAKWAEKRREERKLGGGKARLQKNKGKRGHGNKGSKKK